MTRLVRHAVLAGAALAAVPAAPALAHGGELHALHEEWASAWSASPLQLAPLALAGALYGIRARRLGRRMPLRRVASFYAGLAVVALAICSPLDAVGEEGMFAVHMLQHTLLGAIAPLLVLLGLTGPMLRPLLTPGWTRRLMVLAHPAVALPVWTAGLLVWHVPALHDAAVENATLHAVQHVTIVAFGLIMWAPVVEVLPGPAWFTTARKGLYMTGVWVVGLIAANIFWFSGTAFYGRYAETAPLFGVDALQDQANAGTVMMLGHCMLAFAAAGVLFFRQAGEEQLRQRLVEAGLDPVRVDRAVKAGHGPDLARRHGVSAKLRAGID